MDFTQSQSIWIFIGLLRIASFCNQLGLQNFDFQSIGIANYDLQSIEIAGQNLQ